MSANIEMGAEVRDTYVTSQRMISRGRSAI